MLPARWGEKMEEFGKCLNSMRKVWIFTGGAHGAGGFEENKGFRSSTGLFEEVVRWDMAWQEMAARERFVFNTARPGYNVYDINREFDQRVGCYQPAAVVYIAGSEDWELPQEQWMKGIGLLRERVEAIGARLLVVEAWKEAQEQREAASGMKRNQEQSGKCFDREKAAEYPGDWDSVAEANWVLERIGGWRCAVTTDERNRMELAPATEAFGENGSVMLRSEPMKWLFIGDSITHGALHTHGYDSLPQLWEKYLRKDYGRVDDTVLNTGVSGATAGEFLERLDIRYTPYADADVVVMMFGTNDCCFPESITVEKFKKQLRRILELMDSHGSQVILRIPQPQREDAAERAKALVPFAEAAREVACASNVILVDHFQNFTQMQKEAPERFAACMSDAVHPNTRGQYRMFREMAYAVGMVKEDSMVSLEYKM